ncbi:hypothetical protein [Actinoplanes subglobosus]|uniref:Uncharacterized protein n=1 Tax=Actinoplanes subglobosus TaxID=1547892 RepID=A0ABV8IKD6_9ACTN
MLVFDGGTQLEVGWQGGTSDLSITWNTIDLTTSPTLVGSPYEWRSSRPDPLAEVTGRVLTGWTVTESPYFPGTADLTGDLPMDQVRGWSTHGLWLSFAGIDLHIYSGADITLISKGLGWSGEQGHIRVV